MKYLLTAITAGLLLTACSLPPEKSKASQESVNKEKNTMSEYKTTPPKTQKEILERMLEIMRTSKSIKDFSRERLEQVFGAKMLPRTDDAAGYDFFGPLSDNWRWSFHKYKDPIEGQDGFELSFNPITSYHKTDKAQGEPNIAEICKMDFNEFVRKAEEMGFAQEPNIVQDGMQMGVYLNKDDLQVKAIPNYYYPEDESNPTEKKACIKMILVG